MKLTVSQLSDILAESYTMRQIVAESFLKNDRPLLALQVENAVRANLDNKIAAIKAVRELGNAYEFHGLFPINMPTTCNGSTGLLGLADSKNLVEFVAESIGKPYGSYY